MPLLSKFGNLMRHWRHKPANPAPTEKTQSSAAKTIPEDRQLSIEERTLVGWLLANANGTSDAKPYEEQLKAARVVGRCGCGCPTVDLAVGDDRKATTGPSTILADFLGVTPDGTEV